MARISPDNFDPLRRYVDVRMPMGVPLVDRDWNELADMRRFEHRMFLKWFVGDGVPNTSASGKSDAFKIQDIGQPNDFKILSGKFDLPQNFEEKLRTKLKEKFHDESIWKFQFDHILNRALAASAGRCLVDGLEVFITEDIQFSQQELCKDKTLPERLGVPVPELPDTSQREMLAYLDVWEYSVMPTEDPVHLILHELGIESCARIKRNWVVRVCGGESLPQLGGGDYQVGHSYYPLAILERNTSGSIIFKEDLRQINMTMSSIEKRLKLLEELLLKPVFDSPSHQFYPKAAPIGEIISLYGRNFQLLGNQAKVFFLEQNSGKKSQAEIIRATNNEVLTKVPIDLTPKLTSNIQVAGMFGTTTSDDLFTSLPPPSPAFADDKEEFWPPIALPGELVTLYGKNFKAVVPTLVYFGLTAVKPQRLTDTEIDVVVPNITSSEIIIKVQISVNICSSNNYNKFIVGKPGPKGSLSRIEPKKGVPGTFVNLPIENQGGWIWFGKRYKAQIHPSGMTHPPYVFVPESIPPGSYELYIMGSDNITETNLRFEVLPRP